VPGAVDKSKAQALLPSPARRHPGARETCPVASTQKTRRDWPRPPARPLAVMSRSHPDNLASLDRFGTTTKGREDGMLPFTAHLPSRAGDLASAASRDLGEPPDHAGARCHHTTAAPHTLTPTIQAISASLQTFFSFVSPTLGPSKQLSSRAPGPWHAVHQDAGSSRSDGPGDRTHCFSVRAVTSPPRRSRRSGVDPSGKLKHRDEPLSAAPKRAPRARRQSVCRLSLTIHRPSVERGLAPPHRLHL
jgi:hypothetical protein